MPKTCSRCQDLNKTPVIINGEKFRVCNKYSFEIHQTLLIQPPGMCQQ
jgi:hypothetical protein